MLLAITAVWLRRRRGQTWLLVTLVLIFPLAYFFWWATALAAQGARSGLGPHYYVPAFAFLAVLGGYALERLWARSRALTAVAFAAIAIGTVISMWSPVSSAHDVTDLARAKRAAVEGGDLENAVVVMRADPPAYTLLNWAFLVGNPELRDDVLYAIDRGPNTADLARLFPSRSLHQLVLRTEPGHPLLRPSFLLEPLTVKAGPTVSLPFEIENTTPQPVVTAYVSVDGETAASTTLDQASYTGARYDLTVTLVAPDVPPPPEAPGVLVARVSTRAARSRSASGSGPTRTSPTPTSTSVATTSPCNPIVSRSRRPDCTPTSTSSTTKSGCVKTSGPTSSKPGNPPSRVHDDADGAPLDGDGCLLRRAAIGGSAGARQVDGPPRSRFSRRVRRCCPRRKRRPRGRARCRRSWPCGSGCRARCGRSSCPCRARRSSCTAGQVC